jgi:hypothetical protein
VFFDLLLLNKRVFLSPSFLPYLANELKESLLAFYGTEITDKEVKIYQRCKTKMLAYAQYFCLFMKSGSN